MADRMMTFSELDAAVLAFFEALGRRATYCIHVDTWNHAHGDGTRTRSITWHLYTSTHGTFEAPTPEQLLEQLTYVPPIPPTTETLDSTDVRLSGMEASRG